MTKQELKVITDVGNMYTAFARETISAGQLVKATSENDVVGAAGIGTYASNDIAVDIANAATDDAIVVGIALEDAVSGNSLTISTMGLYILAGQAAVTVGASVSPSNVADAFANSVIDTADTEEEFKIGKALTGASASGTFLIVRLNI